MGPNVPKRFASKRANLLGRGLAVFGLLGWAGCSIEDPAEWGPSPPGPFVPSEPEPVIPEAEPYADVVAELPSEWSEEEKVESLLLSYCGECHWVDPNLPWADEGMAYIDDVDRLVAEAKLVPGQPDESILIQMMVDGSMPPGNYPDAPPELIERVSAFVVGLCSVYEGACEAGADGGG